MQMQMQRTVGLSSLHHHFLQMRLQGSFGAGGKASYCSFVLFR